MQERKVSVQTSLQAIAKKASEQPAYRFRNLFGMLNEEMLRDSWQFIRKNAASGVDRVSAKEYEQNLEENIHQLVEDLKRKRYRAKLAEGSDNSSRKGMGRAVRWEYLPPKISYCKQPSNACSKQSMSKTFYVVVMVIVQT